VPTVDRQIPQRPGRLDNHLVHAVAQPLNQLANDIFALKESARRGVVLNQVAHGCTGPGTICVLG
jgi:hypothetical protein